jgi:hypothetical protein
MGSKDSMPHEIDNFINALRSDPLLKNDFPDVLLSDIKRVQGARGGSPMANFSLLFLPGANGSAASSAGAAAGKKGAK